MRGWVVLHLAYVQDITRAHEEERNELAARYYPEGMMVWHWEGGIARGKRKRACRELVSRGVWWVTVRVEGGETDRSGRRG